MVNMIYYNGYMYHIVYNVQVLPTPGLRGHLPTLSEVKVAAENDVILPQLRPRGHERHTLGAAKET